MGNCQSCSSTSQSINVTDPKTVQPKNGLSNGNGSATKTTHTTQPEAEFIEKVVCSENDLKDNEMKQFAMDDDSKILLVKQHGEFSAIGTKCSHYGALLSTGALGEGRVRCPWHGACFNIKTGDIEDFPGQDAIPCYKVQVDNGQVRVRAKRSDLLANKRTRDMVRRDANDQRCIVVIGGGPSGGVCVETLRQEGFTGRIVLVCREDYLPYDRIKVSKAMDFDIHKAEFRTVAFYEEWGIEAMTGVEATRVDAEAKTVTLSNGYSIRWDKLYIATGSEAIPAPIPGSDLQNVLVMRDYVHSAYATSQLAKDKHVVCLGLSFVGLESAAYCVDKVAKVTVVGRDSVPLRHSFGPEVGARIQRMFEEKGIEFELSSGLRRCIATDGVLTAVELTDGRTLKCDICFMGTGSRLFTGFLADSGIQVNADGSVEVNDALQTNVPDVYAGGDIVNAPVFSSDQRKAVIGHYPLAQYHGRMAAINMVRSLRGEADQPIEAVPFFWTVLFGKSFRYAGHGVPHETHILGSVEDLKYVAVYMDREGVVIGMASCMRDPVVAQFAELLARGKRLTRDQIVGAADPLAWTKEITTRKSC